MQRERIETGLAAAAALLACIIYGTVSDAIFYSDDYAYIVSNTRLQNLPLNEIWRLALERFNPFEFLPLRDLSYWLDMQLFGIAAGGFRAVNMGLYLFCCFMVFHTTKIAVELLDVTQSNQAGTVAALTTLLFSLHPAHVEAVVWISGRKDLLAACFALLSIWLVLKATTRPHTTGRWLVLGGVAFLAALLSKAVSIALAPVFIGLAAYLYKQPDSKISRRDALLMAVLPTLAATAFLFVFHEASVIKTPQYFGWEAIVRFFSIYGWLGRLALSPESRQAFYPVVEAGFLPMAGVGLVIFLALLSGMVMSCRHRKPLPFLLASLLLLLALPYAQIIPYGTHSLVTDRYLFLLSWPVCFALAVGAAHYRQVILIGLLAIPWLYQTVAYTRDWRSPESLRHSMLAATPNHYIPINRIAFAELVPRQKYDEAHELISRIDHAGARTMSMNLLALQRDLDLRYRDAASLPSLMGHLFSIQRQAESLPREAEWNLVYQHLFKVTARNQITEAWNTLTAQHPDDAAVNFNAGLWFHAINEHEMAAQAFLTAARLFDPRSRNYATALKRHGVSLWHMGDMQRAEQHLTEATTAPAPDLMAHCILETFYAAQNRHAEERKARGQCPTQRGTSD